ncbi:glutathione S-transferase domain-containing protein [Pseudomonas aeruginosa]|nr:glutathione S-transferase domain-containing protein [Pseudomonas aeruginosa]
MGQLIDGRWHDQWYDTQKDGRFQRENAQRRHWLGEPAFPAEAGRYHLYVSLACPWAHRTLIVRKLKGLESLIDVSVVSWLMRENGWTFDPAHGSSGDHLDGLAFLHQRYTRDDPHYSGRVTVPLLWDKQAQKIVNNESSDIIRIFNSAFDAIGANALDFYRSRCARRSNASTDASIRRSTTACTVPVSPLARTPTRKPSSSCSRSWTTWKDCSANAATWPVNT